MGGRDKLVREKRGIPCKPFPALQTEQVMGIREAAFSKHEVLPVYDAVGRVCAAETVSCPPGSPDCSLRGVDYQGNGRAVFTVWDRGGKCVC